MSSAICYWPTSACVKSDAVLRLHHTSISREIKRYRPTYADGAVYRYYVIHPVAKERRRTPRIYRCQNHKPLVEYVERKLRLDWPPEAIAVRTNIDCPHDERMRISHETICRWGYLIAEEGTIQNHFIFFRCFHWRQKMAFFKGSVSLGPALPGVKVILQGVKMFPLFA